MRKILNTEYVYFGHSLQGREFLGKSSFQINDTDTYIYRKFLEIRLEVMNNIKHHNDIKWKLIDRKEIYAFDKELKQVYVELMSLNLDVHPVEPSELITDLPLKLAEKLQ